MLDKICKKILKMLCNICKENTYSIIEINDFVSNLQTKLDLEMFKKYIDYLSENKFIDVKYMDDKQICLAIMPKARGVDEEVKYKKKTANKYVRLAFLMSLMSLICGFVGAFLGGYFFEILR